jgi:hypothetical protein
LTTHKHKLKTWWSKINVLFTELKPAACMAPLCPYLLDPVFGRTSPKRLFSMIEIERLGLVFEKTGSINSGTEPKKRGKTEGGGMKKKIC